MKEKPSVAALSTVREEPAAWQKGLSLARSGVNSKFLPGIPQSFWEIRWPLRDVEKAAVPVNKEEHPAELSNTAHLLQEPPVEGNDAKGPRPRIVKCQVSDLEKNRRDASVASLHFESLFSISRTEASTGGRSVVACWDILPSFFIIKGLRINKSDPTRFRNLGWINQRLKRILLIGLLCRRTGRVGGFSCYSS